ncbi:MAG: hypothetical protein KF809_06575 [Chloroflexi bacterium]|nr:hypothetical protein [Chloroflexota bacterium]
MTGRARAGQTRWASRAPWLVVVVASLALAGCGGAQPIRQDPDPLPTPVASLGVALQGTVGLLSDALAAAGYQLAPPVGQYRPSEPASLTHAPRTVLQVLGPEADQGFVVVYDLRTSDVAAQRATELARYLGSGFGQTNFPVDAQFSVAQVGSTVILTWWSRERADDPDRIQGAFDVIRSVGQSVPVVK